jgi:peptide deformylase
VSVRALVGWQDPVLRKRAEPVTAIDDEVRALCQDLRDTMHHCGGIGLAAPQVGISRRVFVTTSPFFPKPERDLVWINPELVWHGARINVDTEACLSLPGIQVPGVRRHHEIKYRTFRPDGKVAEGTLFDWDVRTFEHELEHLNGGLILDFLRGEKRAAAIRVLNTKIL